MSLKFYSILSQSLVMTSRSRTKKFYFNVLKISQFLKPLINLNYTCVIIDILLAERKTDVTTYFSQNDFFYTILIQSG